MSEQYDSGWKVLTPDWVLQQRLPIPVIHMLQYFFPLSPGTVNPMFHSIFVDEIRLIRLHVDVFLAALRVRWRWRIALVGHCVGCNELRYQSIRFQFRKVLILRP